MAPQSAVCGAGEAADEADGARVPSGHQRTL